MLFSEQNSPNIKINLHLLPKTDFYENRPIACRYKTIRYEETDLASLISAPYHFRCGIYLICTQGEAVVSTGVQKYIFNEQTELIFLTGGLLQVLRNFRRFTGENVDVS